MRNYTEQDAKKVNEILNNNKDLKSDFLAASESDQKFMAKVILAQTNY